MSWSSVSARCRNASGVRGASQTYLHKSRLVPACGRSTSGGSLPSRLRGTALSDSKRHPASDRQQARHYGFGSFHKAELLPGALPTRQFSPIKPAYGLYPELLSGTTFTAPRAKNRYTWMYRCRPSVKHDGQYQNGDHKLAKAVANHRWTTRPAMNPTSPSQFRFPRLEEPRGLTCDFLDGMVTLAVNGSGEKQQGAAASVYSCTQSMTRVFRNHDAEMMIIPQSGNLCVRTELGVLRLEPSEFALIPRGMVFRVEIDGDAAEGYVLENFGALFQLPELGPIGISSGLAHPRHFVPAELEGNKELALDNASKRLPQPTEIISKFQDSFFEAKTEFNAFDVVAYYGNYIPVKYDLRDFMAINTVTYDHPDPSIGSVLSSYADQSSGLANIDFVCFPPRYVVAENTFRPPWFHRNFMSEFMGLIIGSYDAKKGFSPGASSIHNAFVPHGPDRAAVENASGKDPLTPERYENALAFMWESNRVWKPTEFALKIVDKEYRKECGWSEIPDRFDPNNAPPDPQPRPFQGGSG
ncbi:unnamed protein product [Amoebophrya sp. A120]|nr:unnamed protein product [Amoebophrya sp. A120]|eukprot:GSA120T00005656001.1